MPYAWLKGRAVGMAGMSIDLTNIPEDPHFSGSVLAAGNTDGEIMTTQADVGGGLFLKTQSQNRVKIPKQKRMNTLLGG